MTDPNSPGLYCIPCCTGMGSALACVALGCDAQGCGLGAAEGAEGARVTPRGGSNRRPGGADDSGPPTHASGPKTLTPPHPCSPPLTSWGVTFAHTQNPLPFSRIAAEIDAEVSRIAYGMAP